MLRRSVLCGAFLPLVTIEPALANRATGRAAPTPMERPLLWIRCEHSGPSWMGGQATSRLEAEVGAQCTYWFEGHHEMLVRVEAVARGRIALAWTSQLGEAGFLSVVPGAPTHVFGAFGPRQGAIYRMSIYMDQDQHLVTRLRS